MKKIDVEFILNGTYDKHIYFSKLGMNIFTKFNKDIAVQPNMYDYYYSDNVLVDESGELIVDMPFYFDYKKVGEDGIIAVTDAATLREDVFYNKVYRRHYEVTGGLLGLYDIKTRKEISPCVFDTVEYKDGKYCVTIALCDDEKKTYNMSDDDLYSLSNCIDVNMNTRSVFAKVFQKRDKAKKECAVEAIKTNF